jgi:hypothetical protein
MYPRSRSNLPELFRSTDIQSTYLQHLPTELIEELSRFRLSCPYRVELDSFGEGVDLYHLRLLFPLGLGVLWLFVPARSISTAAVTAFVRNAMIGQRGVGASKLTVGEYTFKVTGPMKILIQHHLTTIFADLPLCLELIETLYVVSGA